MTGKGTILIVDDMADSLRMLEEILSNKGYQVCLADSGQLALAAADANPPELILLDIRMPGMNGFEVLQQLNKHERTQSIPVIFLSATPDSGEHVEGLRLGAVDFLFKPFQRDELLARVKTHIELGRLRNNLETLVEQRTAEYLNANAQLKHELVEREKETQRTRILLQLHEQVSHLTDRELYDFFLDKAVELSDSEIGFFHRISDDGQHIILTSWNARALEACTAAYETHYPFDMAGNWLDCIREGAPVFYNDFPKSPNQKGLPKGHTPVRRFMSIPLYEGDSPRFVFGVGNKAEPYNEKDIAHIQLVANELQKLIVKRRVEAALRLSQERLQLATRAANIGVWDWDIVANNLVWDESMYRLYGIRREDFTGAYEAWSRCIHPGDAQMANEAIQSALRGEKEYEPEFRIVRPDGAIRHIKAASKTFRDQYGKPRRMIGTNIDITEQKKLESEFYHAQKMEAVGRLAGGVAHDFNNMLGVILGHTDLALALVGPAQPLFSGLQEIHKAALRSAALTRQLLAFARKQTVAPKVLDINESVGSILEMLRRLIGEGIDLAWLPGKNLEPIKMDPSQIDQMLANLCVNARDAIGQNVGKVTIETGMANFDKAYCTEHAGFIPGEYILLAITDNGCGMSKETLAQIFDPFFTTKGVGEGTGLGLSTVYGIVKQNNGFINVYSEPGKGTTFKIYLPRHAAQVAHVTEQAESVAPYGNETILLVEDEPAILNMAQTMLEIQGYTVLAAPVPSEAIRLAREHAGQIHLLITDLIMPEMNGRDLAQNLLGLRPDLKHLFMSGYTANVIAHQGVLDEGVNFIQKPFSHKDLLTKVRAILDE